MPGTMSVCVFLVLALAIISTAGAVDSVVSHDERDLYTSLLDPVRYNPAIRPVSNFNESITVQFGMIVFQLLNVDEGRQTVELNVWLKYMWTDAMLTWDPAEHGEVSQLAIPHDKLWNPDITQFDDASNLYIAPKNKLVMVYPNGMCMWIPQTKLYALCPFNLRHFPFDSHDCSIKFGLWLHDVSKVKLDFFPPGDNRLDMEYFTGHHEWVFTNGTATNNLKKYSCCEEEYGDLTFTYVLTRRAGYYHCIFIAPAIFLAALVPMLFALDHRNKFTLGGAMMVSLSVLIMMLEAKIPVAHGNVPIIAQYFVGLFALTVLAVILSTVTAHLAERGATHPPPPHWLHTIVISWLGRVCCVRSDDYVKFESVPSESMQAMEGRAEPDDVSFTTDNDRNHIVPPPTSARGGSMGGRIQWRLIGVICDRVLFFIFVIGIILFSFVVTSH